MATASSASRARPRTPHTEFDYSQVHASPSERLFPEWDGKTGHEHACWAVGDAPRTTATFFTGTDGSSYRSRRDLASLTASTSVSLSTVSRSPSHDHGNDADHIWMNPGANLHASNTSPALGTCRRGKDGAGLNTTADSLTSWSFESVGSSVLPLEACGCGPRTRPARPLTGVHARGHARSHLPQVDAAMSAWDGTRSPEVRTTSPNTKPAANVMDKNNIWASSGTVRRPASILPSNIMLYSDEAFNDMAVDG